MKIAKFEDLNCWQEARKLRKLVSSTFDRSVMRKDFTLCNQIKSSALSIMANIAEGFESRTNKENVVFLSYSRRSCGELRSHLYAALDDELIKESNSKEIYQQAVSTGKLITSFINYLRKYDFKKRSTIEQSDTMTMKP